MRTLSVQEQDRRVFALKMATQVVYRNSTTEQIVESAVIFYDFLSGTVVKETNNEA